MAAAKRLRKGMPPQALAAKKAAEERRRAEDKITDTEVEFCYHYLGAGKMIGIQAALMAGAGNGSKVHANKWANAAMKRPRVQRFLAELKAKRAEKLSITADEVLNDLIELRDEARFLPRTSANLKTRLAIVEKIGDHIDVGAFRKNVGLSSPTGGPIETADALDMAHLTDEELDQLERARSIIDRAAGVATGDPEPESDPPGA